MSLTSRPALTKLNEYAVTHRASLPWAGIYLVQLHTATKDQRIAFNLLHDKCGSRLQNRYYCPVCNVTVERDDRVRGYELAKGEYVQFTEAELESLETESSNSIELKEFIPLSEIDPATESSVSF